MAQILLEIQHSSNLIFNGLLGGDKEVKMSLSSYQKIVVIIVIAIASLICACGSESDPLEQDELDQLSEELDRGLAQTDLKPAWHIEEEIQRTEDQ